MFERLTNREADVLRMAAEGVKYKDIGKDSVRVLKIASSKLRMSSGCFEYKEQPCTYNKKWYFLNRDKTMQLIERYQIACDRAREAFYKTRTGEN